MDPRSESSRSFKRLPGRGAPMPPWHPRQSCWRAPGLGCGVSTWFRSPSRAASARRRRLDLLGAALRTSGRRSRSSTAPIGPEASRMPSPRPDRRPGSSSRRSASPAPAPARSTTALGPRAPCGRDHQRALRSPLRSGPDGAAREKVKAVKALPASTTQRFGSSIRRSERTDGSSRASPQTAPTMCWSRSSEFAPQRDTLDHPRQLRDPGAGACARRTRRCWRTTAASGCRAQCAHWACPLVIWSPWLDRSPGSGMPPSASTRRRATGSTSTRG